jgi:hypothetical protein
MDRRRTARLDRRGSFFFDGGYNDLESLCSSGLEYQEWKCPVARDES